MTNQKLMGNPVSAAVPVGTIVAFVLPESYVPSGWLLCNGSTIPDRYETLISALNSSNTPDLCGRKLVSDRPSSQAHYNRTQSDFDPSADWFLELTGAEYAYLLSTNERALSGYKYTSSDSSGNFCDIDIPGIQAMQFADDDICYDRPSSPINYIIYAGLLN